MPLRAWLHCGSCNHLWKTSGIRLLCRWITGGTMPAPVSALDVPGDRVVNAPADVPREVPADVPTPRPVDPAIEQWLCQASDDTRPGTGLSVSDWLEAEPLGQPAQPPQVVDKGYFLPPRPSAPAPATLGERLDTFYDGLVRLEEFVKRCAREEEAVAEAVAQAAAASAKVASAGASETATARRGSVLPFHRLAG
jgi:hypothetical protein